MITKPKGTYDILPNEVEEWVALESVIRKVCQLYNFMEIRTPIFEAGELIHRNQTDSSDMVNKETYDFVDRGGRNMVLRPEGTAGVCRAYVENKLYVDQQTTKVFYMGPMFRYERPQKGRNRQFNQFGLELYNTSSPLSDAEVIATASAVIKALGLKGIKVKINSIGDEESRKIYKDVLVKYFDSYKVDLCEDCNIRLNKNPLRILDCKVDRNKEFFKNAPKIKNYLSLESKNHFSKVLAALDQMNIKYEIDDNLVRGLDYYTHTVFEIEIDVPDFGAQNVICAGGRYNNLVEEIGGPNIPAVGLAFGMERLLLATELTGKKLTKEKGIDLFIIALGDSAVMQSIRIADICRLGGLKTELDFSNKGLKAQFKIADKNMARFTAILGDQELNDFMINVKDNLNDTQERIGINEIYPYIVKKYQEMQNLKCSSCAEKSE